MRRLPEAGFTSLRVPPRAAAPPVTAGAYDRARLDRILLQNRKLDPPVLVTAFNRVVAGDWPSSAVALGSQHRRVATIAHERRANRITTRLRQRQIGFGITRAVGVTAYLDQRASRRSLMPFATTRRNASSEAGMTALPVSKLMTVALSTFTSSSAE